MKYRILKRTVNDKVSYYYPQWSLFGLFYFKFNTDYGEFSCDTCFETLEETKQFLENFNNKTNVTEEIIKWP